MLPTVSDDCRKTLIDNGNLLSSHPTLLNSTLLTHVLITTVSVMKVISMMVTLAVWPTLSSVMFDDEGYTAGPEFGVPLGMDLERMRAGGGRAGG